MFAGSGCDILLKDDKSVSRKHAVITVVYAPAAQLTVKGQTAFCCAAPMHMHKAPYGSKAPTCRLPMPAADQSSMGSLFGMGDEQHWQRLNKGEAGVVQEGDFLMFGHRSLFRQAAVKCCATCAACAWLCISIDAVPGHPHTKRGRAVVMLLGQ